MIEERPPAGLVIKPDQEMPAGGDEFAAETAEGAGAIVRVVKDLFLERTRDRGTVFMSTHTLEVAEAVADRIGIIHRGELIAVGTLPELRQRATQQHSLEEIFLELTESADGTEHV